MKILPNIKGILTFKRISINILILSIAFVLQSDFLKAQEHTFWNSGRHSIGFMLGYGEQDLHHLITIRKNNKNEKNLGSVADAEKPSGNRSKLPYKYQVTFYQFQYDYSWKRHETWGMDIIVQPQYNNTRYLPDDQSAQQETGYEYGLNIGLLLRKNILKDDLSIYTMVSSGPHYSSGTPERQAKGFIFSDNIFAGINIKLAKDLFLDVRSGIRHISNASLKSPNAGVNDFVINGGAMIHL